MWFSHVASLIIICICVGNSMEVMEVRWFDMEDAMERFGENDAKVEPTNPHIIFPKDTTKKMTWLDALARCGDMGAVPFVPKTAEDMEMINTARLSLGRKGYMWFPASDITEEGVLRWWDGQTVTPNIGK
ncbi:unnamed protein product, partial [Meganyctiphanes norvegica]